jgi:hypothetical protein
MMPLMLIASLHGFTARAVLIEGMVVGGLVTGVVPKPQLVRRRRLLRLDSFWRTADAFKERAELDAHHTKGIRPRMLWDSPGCRERSA